MNVSWCPYCNSVKSLLPGHVYCSRQAAPMTALSTGSVFIKSRSLEETDDHESRLSIRCMLNGDQRYRVGGNEHLVTPTNYLVVNEGQHYRTSFKSSEEQEMILVAFRPGLAESMRYAFDTDAAGLIDDPFGESEAVHFYEHTYPQDAVIHALFLQLRRMMDIPPAERQMQETEAIYDELLARLFAIHQNLRPEQRMLRSAKQATRAELYRRLHIARDYMDAQLARPLRVDDAAGAACLSVHHFKRAFKELFGITPHRYLVSKRLERAVQLLQKGQLSVDEVSRSVGFENTSSFIRLFRQRTGSTPRSAGRPS